MLTISGYQITEQIQATINTSIYRGVRKQDKTAVIIKTIPAEYPTLEQITRLRHEYKILQALDIKGIVRVYSLENYQNRLALILEDLSGQSLKQFITYKKLEIRDFLDIAIQLAEALGDLHKNHIIHKDIKPHNILINPSDGQVKIIDFSIASRLERENPSLSNPNQIEGTLAYMSPEQTGRMNRALDYRTDFYSLGITFYEMLTGQLPFNSSDPLELVHCHIAFPATPPHQINPEIPLAVAHIVMKLLAKTAEERYQSAWGIKADLETCLAQLQTTGNIAKFTPGKQDLISQFLIPQKLYGRTKEVTTLMEAFGRVASGGSEIILVSGYSGIGKTSVINEIHKPIVGQRGYFISGKFDQFKRNIPYASIIQAFQQLSQQILTESASKIATWKAQLLAAFGQQGNVIIDVIPQIELIVGPQPPVPQLGPTESQNRFNRVFREFIHVFTKAEHPLVLFLDDLQWADSASLKLIQLLITDPDSEYLLLMGAYRDNEVFPTHPLLVTLDEIKNTGAKLSNITLRPLNIENASELVADTLHASTERSQNLAELVYNKTQGNPFFLTQLLSTLHQEKLLKFDFKSGDWHWDIEQIQAVGITDYNVVELLSRHIQKLPEPTQKVLKLAACIGDKFNLDVLAIVNEKSSSETATELWDALQAGLILPLSESYKVPLVFDLSISAVMPVESLKVRYKFLHDRVQQAAYSLIPEEEKKETHLQIGQLLLKNTPFEKIEDNIFEIVNQLNVGIEFISNPVEKYELARLNLIAGKKAKAANAYEPALKYLTVGLELLGSNSWQSQYNLTLNLYEEAAEAEYLNGNFERAGILVETVVQQAKSLLDKVKAYELKMQMYIVRLQYRETTDTGISVLEMLGVSLEEEPPKGLIIAEAIDLPILTDPNKIAALRILTNLIAPGYASNPVLLLQVVFTMVALCIKYGNSPQGAYAYSLYGMILSAVMGDIDSGYQFCQVAVKLVENFGATELKAKVLNVVNSCVRHWKEPAQEMLEDMMEGIQSGLETGDIEHASYCAVHYCNHTLLLGKNLELVERRYAQYLDLMQKLKLELSTNYLKIGRQLALNLQGKASDKMLLKGESFDENEQLPILIQNKDGSLLLMVYVAKLLIYYLFKEPVMAVESAKSGSPYLAGSPGLILINQHNFYYSLALLAVYPNVAPEEQKQYLNEVSSNQEKMQQWANIAPSNFLHKYELVEAEKARVLGEVGKAMEYYDRAIFQAKESGYIHEEAIANELAAEFYFSRSKDKVAQIYLTDAYYGYIRWGATAKVRQLEEIYPQLLQQTLASTNIEEKSDRVAPMMTIYSTTGSSAALDLATVMKASQAISSEIFLDNLLEKLMNILLENAGAQRGFLLLDSQVEGNEGDSLVLAAEGAIDRENQILLPNIPINKRDNLPFAIVNYVQRTQSNVVLNDAQQEGIFTTDSYITNNKIKSLLCTPILHQGKLVGILYLENNTTKSAFTPERLEVLRLLSSSVAVSLQNALLFAQNQDTMAHLNAIMNNIADGLLVTDTTGKIIRFNPALLAMFGLSNSALIGKNCQSVFNSEMVSLVAQTQKSPAEVFAAEIALADRRVGQAVATAISSANSPQISGCAIVIRDITAQKEIDRMKTDFISTVSHELRTPLTSVLGFTKIIKKKLEEGVFPLIQADDRKAQKMLRQVGENINIIVSEGERLTSLINDVLDIAKMEAGKVEWQMQPVSIAEIIERAIAATSSLFLESGLKLHKDVPDGLRQVLGDSDRLLQVLINLISNAVKFTETGSCTIKARQQDNQIIVNIIDTGIGIAPFDKQKVFEKFQQVGDTLTDKPKGSGLGLPICKQIVEHHGGTIWVESQLGQGSNFSFSIPIPDRIDIDLEKFSLDILVKQLKQNFIPTTPLPGEQEKTILIVDDDKNIRALLRQQLESEGYQIREAKDGIDAINQVKHKKPDLIILDVMMPHINGFDVAAVLKNDPQTMSIPIIILSIVEDKQRGYRLGIDSYFTKPVNAKELHKNIGLLLSQGISKKKVLVVDEDASDVKTISEVLQAKGYSVMEASNEQECIDKALAVKPDMIIVNSLLSQQQNLVKTLCFEKGLENVFFVLLTEQTAN